MMGATYALQVSRGSSPGSFTNAELAILVIERGGDDARNHEFQIVLVRRRGSDGLISDICKWNQWISVISPHDTPSNVRLGFGSKRISLSLVPSCGALQEVLAKSLEVEFSQLSITCIWARYQLALVPATTQPIFPPFVPKSLFS
jgi:hypothetical protein